MIDLSHLTEEEQGMIMTVLRRDAELKKAEEERIRKLEKILNTRSQADSKLKYLTGEWFYEAKSRRHMDKIHGSEIILASMKRKTSGLDGSLRAERSKTLSAPGSDIVPPPKPARCLEAPQPQDMNDAEKENLNSAVRSPRTPRHNPFNRASLIVVEPPENNTDTSITQDQESSETEPLSPLKHHPPREASQTSGGSVTSETSSGGFKPVPKKRTFLSRRSSTQTDSNDTGSDPQVTSKAVVPAPRRRIQRGSSGSTNQSGLTNQDEMSQKTTVPASNQVSQTAQPSSTDETSQEPQCYVSQISSNSIMNKERNLPSITNDRLPTFVRGDMMTERETPQRSDERHEQTPTEQAEVSAVPLHSSSIQDSDRENSSSVGTAMRQGELSLPQSVVDAEPPVSYYLNFIDKSDQQTQKSNEKNMFKLSTQITSPTDEEEDSIAKVLDWFSRSTDSSVWLKTEGNRDATKTNSDKSVEINKTRGEDSVRKDAGDFISERKKETLETKRSHLQRLTNEAKDPRATDRTGHKEVTETREELLKDTRERMRSQEVKDNDDENQPPKISHLKSFWEKSSKGPKILISKSITPSDKGQHLTHLSVEKDEENVNKPHAVSDMPSVPLIHNGKGIYNKNGSNHEDEREQQLVVSPQKEIGDSVHLNNNQVDLTHNSDQLTLLSSPQVVDRRGSDAEILSVSRLSLQPKTVVQSSPESESITSVKPNPQLDSIFQSRETPLQEELPKMAPMSQIDTDVQSKDSPDSEKLYFSRSSPFMDGKQVGNDVQISSKAQLRRGSVDDIKRRNSEDKIMQSSMSPKRKESNKDRSNSSHSNRPHQDSAAERIKQLKSFWEQERNQPAFYTGKPKPSGEGKVARGANLAKMNKRFTKSEYDLRTIGNDSDNDDENSERNLNFSITPLNQRGEKSPSLGTSRTQFNTLREFWDEATSDTKGFFSSDKPKNTKRKDSLSAQLPSQELKSGDPEIHRLSSAVEKTRPAVIKSSLSPQSRSKSPHDRQTGSGSRGVNESKNNVSNYTTAESRRSSKDSGREEKSSKPQSSSGKETRSPKSRKDSFSNSSSRGNSLRRATSMFALSVPDEKDQGQLKIDVSPVHSQSRKQRQNAEKAVMPRRSSEDSETLTLRARAFVPRDYRHYLGMTDTTSALAPAVKGEGSESKSRYEFDPSGPIRASTPVSSDERLSRKSNKTSQRPLWANYSSSDTGPESSVSSVSETWSTSRNSSNRENDDDSQNPVRKALRRAEARPKNLTKSVEDITASLSPRQDRRADPTADHRRGSDVSSIPSPSTSLFSDPDHLKKMSKSVPSFLQKEDAGKDIDSTCEDSYHRGRLMTGSSMTNLTSSSGMASVSSLSGSVMTMYSADFGNVEVQGTIQFSINYIQKLREFHIFVAECRDLAAVDPKRGRSDPYVKSYLVPDKANLGKRKTSVKKKTQNPTFNEILRYRVRMEYLRTQTLILSVWHHDTFGRNSFLGEVDVDLSKWDFDHTQMNYLALKARTTPTVVPSNGRGEMRLAIRFLPQITHSEGIAKDGPNTGEIHIWVKECKNLPPIRATIDPYVKCFVLPDTSRKSRQKTRVLQRTVDPVFNHTMVYDGISKADLTEACVELTVWDRDRLASNLLGGLRLGAGTGKSYGAAVDWMDSTAYEVALWDRMMASPNEWVEDVLPLRMVNSAKAAFK